MAVTKNLQMVFAMEDGSKITYSLADPREDITRVQVETVMNTLQVRTNDRHIEVTRLPNLPPDMFRFPMLDTFTLIATVQHCKHESQNQDNTLRKLGDDSLDIRRILESLL